MTKLLLGIITIAVLSFVVFAMMCAMIIASHSDEDEDCLWQDSEKEKNTFVKQQLCTNCKVGKQSYEIDNHSEVCPYISCWKDDTCYYYEPIE